MRKIVVTATWEISPDQGDDDAKTFISKLFREDPVAAILDLPMDQRFPTQVEARAKSV
jgi:hypothetical protein